MMITLMRRTFMAALLFAILAATIPGDANAQSQAMRQACREDYERFCAGTTPGGGRILACLQSHGDKLGSQCREAIAKAGK
jgi:hypothetical protein